MPQVAFYFSYLVQIFVLTIFWVGPLKRKDNFWLRVALCMAGMCAAILLADEVRLLLKTNWAMFSFPFLLILCLFALSLKVCFDEPWDVILLTMLLSPTAQLCASAISNILYYVCSGTRENFYLFDFVSLVIICAVSWKLGKLYKKLWFYDRDIFRVINALGFCIVSCVFILNGFSSEIHDRFVRYVLIAGYRFLMSSFVFFMVFSLMNVGRTRYQKALTDVLLKKQEQQFALSKDLTELVNIKYHDIKHMQYAEAGEAEQERQRLSHYECMIHCGNAALDTALTEKTIVCRRNNIDFTMMVDGALLDFMVPVDIYALFGNMLDNAISCLTQLPENERHLKLRVCAAGKMVSILCENICHDTLQFEDGLPQTTKDDILNHGFGTRSIARICQRYHAQFRMACENGFFTLQILIPATQAAPN